MKSDEIRSGKPNEVPEEPFEEQILSEEQQAQQEIEEGLSLDEEAKIMGVNFGPPPEGTDWTNHEKGFMIGFEKSLSDGGMRMKLALWQWQHLSSDKKRYYIHNVDSLVRWGQIQGFLNGNMFTVAAIKGIQGLGELFHK